MQKETLLKDYKERLPTVNRFGNGIRTQIDDLLKENSIPIGVPLEWRIKTWSSISEKIDSRSLELKTISDLSDLIGFRLILLFKRDLNRASDAIANTFEVVSKEDTSERLDETQFGYQSLHYIIELPKAWLSLPTFHNCENLCAEVQIRTLAQHIWAAASHQLQYKNESSVPPPVRRAIHRASALLETVDLEFERVLQERDTYKRSDAASNPDSILNVDLLSQVLDEALPLENRDDDYEYYDELLLELKEFGIKTISQLQILIRDHLEGALQEEEKFVKRIFEEEDFGGTTQERFDRGVYFTHVGLVRNMCELKFGEPWKNRKNLQED